MALVNKAVAPTLDPDARGVLARTCGLDRLDFFLKENVGELALRVLRFRDGGTEALLDTDGGECLITVDYPADGVVSGRAENRVSLWEAILPDPLSQLGKFLQGGFLDYRVEPPRFGLALEELFDAFREAEERLAMTEQSVISFEAPAGELSYLLHFSRHRLVGISRPPVVDDLARRFRESGLEPSDLAAALGSPATLLRVSIAPEAACPLGALASALRDGLADSTRCLDGLSRDGFASGYELGL